MNTWITAHQSILIIIVAILTGVREVLDVVPGESTPAGVLDALVSFIKQVTSPPPPAPPTAPPASTTTK